MGRENFKLYNAISPFNIRFFDGQQNMGNTKFDPENENQIFQFPVYEDGKHPLKIKIRQYYDSVINREVLHVHNLGTPFTFKVSKNLNQFEFRDFVGYIREFRIVLAYL